MPSPMMTRRPLLRAVSHWNTYLRIDRSRESVQFRKDVARAMVLGFQPPTTFVKGVNGRQEKTVEAEAVACEAR